MAGSIKIQWDNAKEVFWVKVGHKSSKDRIENRSSRKIVQELGSLGISDWSWSFSAKRAVGRGR